MALNTKLNLWLSGAGLLIVCLILIVFRNPNLSFLNSILGALALILTIIPSIQYAVTSPDHRPIIPLLPLIGIFYLFFFVLPIFYFYYFASSSYILNNPTGRISVIYQDGVRNESIILVCIGMLVFQCGWQLTKSRLFSFIPKFSLPKKNPPYQLLILAVGLLLGGLSYYYIEWVRALPSVGQFFIPAGYAGLGLIYLLWRHDKVSWGISIPIMIVLGGFLIASFVLSGFMTSIVYVLIFLIILDFWCTKKIRKIYALGGLAISLVVFLLHPINPQIRSVLWTSDPNLSAVEKSKTAIHMVYDTYLGDSENYILNGKVSFNKNESVAVGRHYLLHRMSGFSRLNHVIKQTPQKISFLHGATYETLFVSLIPRFLWPNKPQEKWGNSFGRRYSLIDQNDRQTSANIGWITELYANFGWGGVILGMFSFGAMLSMLERFFMHSNVSVSEVAVGSAILLPLFYQESNFTLMTGSVIPLTLCMWFYFHIGGKVLMTVFKPVRL